VKQSKLEQKFEQILINHKIAGYETEYVFAKPRRWRFDFAFPSKKIAFEVEGGGWVQGRHNRGPGFDADCQKYNQANLLSWDVYRITGSLMKIGYADEIVKRVFKC